MDKKKKQLKERINSKCVNDGLFVKIRNEKKGITLVALVVTIVVLLILAGITITMLFGENGIIKKAQDAADATKNDQDTTINELANLEQQLNEALRQGGPKVTLANGTTVTLTKENFGDYLGKKVANYKTVGGTENVTVTTANYGGVNEFTVSTTYRLYYVDFDNKYGDGAGTVYLKADQGPTNYNLSVGKTTNDATIKNLNPELYKEGVTAPTNTNNNMKAVTWLLDTEEWKGLVTSGSSTPIADKVNYVVGAPSLEMMMDSYNAHYKLEGDTPDYTDIPAAPDTTRKKIFYKYTSGETGYQVGPNADNDVEYSPYTSDNSVKTDSSIDSMYYPGSGKYYWLASPSSYFGSGNDVMFVYGGRGGFVSRNDYSNDRGVFCPLVSLNSNVQLELVD